MVEPLKQDDWKIWVSTFELNRDSASAKDDFCLVDQGYVRKSEGSLEQAQNLFEQAISWARHARTPDARRVYAEALVCLGDLARIRSGSIPDSYYQKAKSMYEALSPHNLGVVAHHLATWYEENGKNFDAWGEYNLVLTLWRELAREHGRLGNRKRYARYQEQIRLLETQIEELLKRAAQAPSNDAEETGGLPPAQPDDSEKRVYEQSRVWVEEGFQEIPVLDAEVAAGEPIAVGEDIRIGQIRVGSIVLLDGEQFVPVSLVDGSTYLNLLPDYMYSAIRIRGISMNRAIPVAIFDGNWVIVRRPKEGIYFPSDGQIVVAILPDVADRRALLKRFRGDRVAFSLVSETSEPDLPPHKPRAYTWRSLGELPQYVGQAIFVLKPLPRATDNPRP